MTTLLSRIIASATETAAGDPASSLPFAILRRQDGPGIEVFTGDVTDVEKLADIPLGEGSEAPTVLSLVPYRQVRERGFAAKDDGAPLRCLVVTESQIVGLDELLAALPDSSVPLTDGGFNVSDSDYGDTVRRVIEQEIGRGEGANFVIRRDYTAHTDIPAARAVLGWLRALLEGETGAYWTFAVHTPDVSMAGATPERHVGVEADTGVVTMNPISGTYRHPAEGPSAEGFRTFLGDVKETEELFMVVDEEMKMMSKVCSSGGRILGPFITQMSRLTHTEYRLEGISTLDVREVLRLTMFAPTVTGSPMQNACTVIARHEQGARGYYSGVLALFTPGENGYSLDAPILIRAAYINDAGDVRVPVGATLVRHSDPDSEAAETTAKAAGVLTALGVLEAGGAVGGHVDLAVQPGVADALRARNLRLAKFWLEPQGGVDPEDPATAAGAEQAADAVYAGPFEGKSALIVDAEDEFTAMLAHQLRHLGMAVTVLPWSEAAAEGDGLGAEADLLVTGPGPGDPLDSSIPRIAAMRTIVARRLESGEPLLAVCLTHQILADTLGLPIERLDAPRQGVQLDVDLYGTVALLGFYNTFTARGEAPVFRGAQVEVARDPESGDIFSLRGPKFASVQGHLESVLSRDGLKALEQLVGAALA